MIKGGGNWQVRSGLTKISILRRYETVRMSPMATGYRESSEQENDFVEH